MLRFALLILPVSLLTVPLYPSNDSQAAVVPADTAAAPRSVPCTSKDDARVALEGRETRLRIILPDLLGGVYPSMSVQL